MTTSTCPHRPDAALLLCAGGFAGVRAPPPLPLLVPFECAAATVEVRLLEPSRQGYESR